MYTVSTPLLLSTNYENSGVPFQIRMGQTVSLGRNFSLLPSPSPQPESSQRKLCDVTVAFVGGVAGSADGRQLARDEVRKSDDHGGREAVRGSSEEFSAGKLAAGDWCPGRGDLHGHAAAEVDIFSLFHGKCLNVEND